MQHWQQDKQAWIESTRIEQTHTESLYISVFTGLAGFSATLAAILVMFLV